MCQGKKIRRAVFMDLRVTYISEWDSC